MAGLKINRRLNLVLDVERADGSIAHVHHVPISEEVFDVHWEVITRTVSRFYMREMLPAAAVRVGLNMMLSVADDMGIKEKIERELLPNFWRSTTVILPSDKGWVPTPLDVVVASKQGLDSEDLKEVKNYIAFFTSASWVHRREELGPLLYQQLRSSGGRFESWTCTEFVASLQTSITPASSGPKEMVSELPR